MLSLHTLLILAILAIILYLAHGFLNIKWQHKAFYGAIVLHGFAALLSEFFAWQQPIYHQHIIYLHILMWLTFFGGLLYISEYRQAFITLKEKKTLKQLSSINYMFSIKRVVQISSIIVLLWVLYAQSAHYVLFTKTIDAELNLSIPYGFYNNNHLQAIILSIHMLALAASYMLVIAIIIHNWLIFYLKRYLQKPMQYQNAKGLQGNVIKHLQQLPSLEYLYQILQQRLVYLMLSMFIVLASGGLLLLHQSSSSIKIFMAVFNFIALCLLWLCNKRYGLAQKYMTLMGMAIGSIWLSIHMIFKWML